MINKVIQKNSIVISFTFALVANTLEFVALISSKTPGWAYRRNQKVKKLGCFKGPKQIRP